MFNIHSRALSNLLATFLARKTIHSFAEPLDELPAALLPAFAPHLSPSTPLLMILRAPSQSVLPRQSGAGWGLPWEITPSRVVALQDDCLVVAATPYGAQEGDAPVAMTRIPLEDILALESGFVLLTAWLDCTWAQAGRLERLRIDYNTVSRALFESLGAKMRIQMARRGGCDWRVRSAELQPPGLQPPGLQLPGDLAALNAFPYKFRQLIPHHLLLEGEPVCAAAFQAGKPQQRGWLGHKQPAPNRAALRTPAHLILCSEEATPAGEPYGLVGQFLPLNRVGRISSSSAGWTLVLERAGVSCEVDLPASPGEESALRGVFQI